MKNKPKIEGSQKEQFSFDRVVYGLVKFVEIGKSAVIKVSTEKRKVNPQNMFRLECNIDFAINILINYFMLAPSYLQELADNIVQEKEFMDEVNRFADTLAPDKSVLITDNINREFKDATTVNQFAKGIKTKEKR